MSWTIFSTRVEMKAHGVVQLTSVSHAFSSQPSALAFGRAVLCCVPLSGVRRNEHTETCSLLHSHGAPPPSPAANDEATPSEGKNNATGEKSRKIGRLIFGRKPWGGDSTSSGVGSAETPIKDRRTPRKGRGKRPGSSRSSVASETLNVTPCGQRTSWLNDPLEDGWVLCTDSDGFRYYWNEVLQETRCSFVSRLDVSGEKLGYRLVHLHKLSKC